jgi:hypothetical protein
MNGTSPPLHTWVTLKHPAFVGHGTDIAFLTCAANFDPRRPFFIVLFFHGFRKPIDEQVERHDLANQVARARRNCVLICPRISLNDGSGNNPGSFRDAEQVASFLDELPGHIIELTDHGDLAAVQTMAAKAPLVLATFSGGHSMASQMLLHDVSNARTECCAFFDSLYGSDRYFRQPEEVLKNAALVGIHRAAYDGKPGSDECNKHKDLGVHLAARHVVIATSLDQIERLRAGVAVLQSVDEACHWNIVSSGSPLQQVLTRFTAKAGQSYELRPSPSV